MTVTNAMRSSFWSPLRSVSREVNRPAGDRDVLLGFECAIAITEHDREGDVTPVADHDVEGEVAVEVADDECLGKHARRHRGWLSKRPVAVIQENACGRVRLVDRDQVDGVVAVKVTRDEPERIASGDVVDPRCERVADVVRVAIVGHLGQPKHPIASEQAER